MFSPRFYKIISWILNLGRILNLNPCLFYPVQFIFAHDPQINKRIKKFFAILIGYSVLKLVHVAKLRQEQALNEYHLNMAFFLATLTLFITYGIPTWFSKDVVIILNGVVTFFRYLQCNYLHSFRPEKARLNWIIDTLIAMFIMSVLILNLFVILLLLYDPRGPISLGALIPEKYFSFPIKLVVWITHIYGLTALMINIAICGICIMTYLVYVTIFLTGELRLGRSKYLSVASTRSPENLRHLYRSFQVLHQNGMCFLGLFLVMCNAAFMLAAIYLNFVLLHYWEELHLNAKAPMLFATLMAMGFWSVLLDLGRAFYARGNCVLTSWRQHKWNSGQENKLMKKFRRSSKPILLSYGRQFVVGRTSVFVYFRGVTRGTMRALLTSK